MRPPTETTPPAAEPPATRVSPSAPVRIPSRRWTAALAAAMLAAGVAVGAAIGPAPAASLAGQVPSLAEQLPLLIAGIEATHRASTPPQPKPAKTATPAASPEPAPAPNAVKAAKPAPATEPAAPAQTSSPGQARTPVRAVRKLPAITNVWLIALSGTGFSAALAQTAAAPYIDGTLVPSATLLSGWSAVDANAFAAEATLAKAPVAGATPPLLHSIVQPPCPEGAAGASCAPETAGQLTAADDFLKATLATITPLSTYREHGLIVISFSTVGIATQSELPAGASTSTLAYQPPAGVALLSPFAKPGASSARFYPTSPRRSLERLLH